MRADLLRLLLGLGLSAVEIQGVRFRGSGDPVLYLSNPDGMWREVRRGLLDDLAKLNEQHYAEFADPEIDTRITQYEMAYKMQASVPDLIDFTKESPETLDMYGPDVKRQGSFAYNCLMARRLVERGVRFVQFFHAGWDHHNNLSTQFKIQCHDTDHPAPRWSRISSSAACSTTRSSSGAANLAARLSCKATSRTRSIGAAIIIPTPSPCGWPAPA